MCSDGNKLFLPLPLK